MLLVVTSFDVRHQDGCLVLVATGRKVPCLVLLMSFWAGRLEVLILLCQISKLSLS